VSGEGILTAFDRPQRELGGEFVVGLGWRWTKTFGDPPGEYDAVRHGVGVWDASPHTKWDFRGRDSIAALDRIFTRDLSGQEIGQVCYGPFCDENGKMLGDGTVFRFSDDHCWLVTAPGTESDLEHFHRVADGLGVTIEKRTHELPQLGINGPRSRELLAGLCDRDLSSLRYYRFWPEQARIGGVPCWVSRTGYSGELGFELFCAPEDAERLWQAVTEAGARPYGLDAIEWIRIESGLIAFGADFFAGQTSPFDMSLDRFVDLRKQQAFSGRDVLAEEAKAPARALVTLVVEGEPPASGAAVTRAGESVGAVTSPCLSPELGRAIALAVVRRDLSGVGEQHDVAVDGGTARATVAPISIVDPEKKRPRA
jgi:aminomethyltransferase